ncbi:phenylacetaldoxime dehydratase [Trichoderma arundinaceum]|uniref:Phenylacetaldoxime dehydratase n=1 Tax=Trichoderma arundinaceum TaxID=490622 RepID=A0A395NTQ2_TRIAR|nr:phenylacetaldoxime dehydratase [Trichoderma arundinaceum]
MTLVTAIPEHLQVERTISASTPANFDPPFPAYSAQFAKDVSSLVMAIIGAQFPGKTGKEKAAISKVNSFLALTDKEKAIRPAFSEWASATDHKGFYNVTAIAYWKDEESYQKWTTKSGFRTWWESLDTREQENGWFLELFFPTMDRFETVFSSGEIPEGAAQMRDGIVGPIKEHVYWGSMRDRLAVAQTDALIGEEWHMAPVEQTTNGNRPRRIRVPGKKNLAIIRSGQDWADTAPEERKLYVNTMHPVLEAGMNFLRDHGDEVGCYSCRFMEIIDPATRRADKDRTFGLAYFDELASLEKWSKQHPTHLAIFAGFLKYAAKLNNVITLRLFHEVMVVKSEQQLFEYVGCHPETGMLVAAEHGN